MFFAKIVGSLATSSNFVTRMKQQALEVFEIFEKVHGAVSAKTIVEYLENTDSMAIQREISARIAQLATKEDVALVKNDVTLVKSDVALLKKDVSILKDDVALVKSDVSFVKKDLIATREELLKQIAASKVELRSEMADLKVGLRSEMGDLKVEVRTEMGGLKAEVRTEMGDLKAEFKTELKTEISCLRADLIKTFFVMNMAQLLAIVASVLAIIKFMLK